MPSNGHIQSKSVIVSACKENSGFSLSAKIIYQFSACIHPSHIKLNNLFLFAFVVSVFPGEDRMLLFLIIAKKKMYA